jgi:hypothetical protein
MRENPGPNLTKTAFVKFDAELWFFLNQGSFGFRLFSYRTFAAPYDATTFVALAVSYVYIPLLQMEDFIM